MKPGLTARAALLACTVFTVTCSSQSPAEKGATQHAGLDLFTKVGVDQHLAAGDWAGALQICQGVLGAAPADCGANYCNLIASTMQVVDSINSYGLPTARSGPPPGPLNTQQGQLLASRLEQALQAAQSVTTLSCEYDAPTIPVTFGDAADPILKAEVRGVWTTRTAALLGAAHAAMLYDLQQLAPSPPPAPPSLGPFAPPLPSLLAIMKAFMWTQQFLLLTQPTTPWQLRGGWFDRNGDHVPNSGDELLVDLFFPGSQQRVFDFSQADFVTGQMQVQEPLTPTLALPPARCGYQKFHIDDLASDQNVGAADGITLSPDGKEAVVPLSVGYNRYQLYGVTVPGGARTCLTCAQPGNNDGARWRPGAGDVILFVSTRDHSNAIGGDGAGIGQELYVMRPDGTNPVRLTTSGAWATNYHANWSPDGKRIVWGSTQNRTWDVMVADYLSDATGPRLANVRRVVHDTTWWETHGFSADGSSVITTNTRAAFLSTDIYAVDIATGARKRLTSDLAWDEHAHLSPDGRKLSWISGRWRPAAVSALNDGSLSPIFDFLTIVPGILFEFLNPPAGYSTELTMMDADGSHVQALTTDNQIVADNQWSADARQIIFRQTDITKGRSRVRLLTFDDCP